jgi:hypothetical protein
MFDNNKNIDSDEKIARRTFKKAFCNENNTEEHTGC